jgi:hypothetical protein
MQQGNPTPLPTPQTSQPAVAPTPRPGHNSATTARQPVHPAGPTVRPPVFTPNEQLNIPTRARDLAGAPLSGGKEAPSVGTNKAEALARLIAEGRRPRSRRFAELEPYRNVLLTERDAGASIRLMAESLAKLGVAVSEETLRVWLLRQKMPKRRKARTKPVARSESPAPPSSAPTVPQSGRCPLLQGQARARQPFRRSQRRCLHRSFRIGKKGVRASPAMIFDRRVS